MKKTLLFAIISLFIIACSPKEHLSRTSKTGSASAVINADSLEHEIIILDPEFDRWYQTRFSEATDRSNEFYQSMNSLGTLNWNLYYNSGKYSNVISSYIDYRNSTDYGIEVNRKLYWYFKYIEEKFRIRLFR